MQLKEAEYDIIKLNMDIYVHVDVHISMPETHPKHNQSLLTLQQLFTYQVIAFLLKSEVAAGSHFVRVMKPTLSLCDRPYLSNKTKKKLRKSGIYSIGKKHFVLCMVERLDSQHSHRGPTFDFVIWCFFVCVPKAAKNL